MIRAVFVATLALAAPLAQAQTAEELQRLLQERDARIRELNAKLDALEKKPEDDDELNRALERTLVQQGAMVLPRRVYEVEPQLSSAHWDRERGPFRYVWTAAINARAGIGWDAQLDARLPYVHAASATDSATELGDVSISITKQLAREAPRRPGVLAALAWTTHSGQDPFGGGVPTGSGFNVPQAAVTLVKRDDPLVYFGGLSYSAPRARDIGGMRVEPGGVAGLRGGAILAAAPHSSINVGVNLASVAAARVDGQRVPDSDTVLGTLELGFGTVLSRSVMLNAGGEFRVSGQVPNFRLVLGLPIRF